ncbi:MAG: helix-turn-helix domain-containing protein [Cyclobacteriaceae bacterium]
MPRYQPVKEQIPAYTYWNFTNEKQIFVKDITAQIEDDLEILQAHHLSYYAIRHMYAGSGTIYIDHVPYKLTNNWTMLATPKQICWMDIPAGTEVKVSVIAFSQSFFDRMGFTDNLAEVFSFANYNIVTKLNAKKSEEFQTYLRLIRQEYQRDQSESVAIMVALVKALLHVLSRECPSTEELSKNQRDYTNLYLSYLELLNKNYREMHYVADYTESLAVSEKTLNRACQAIARSSAGKIIQQRLNFEAKRLLFTTSNTVKEIGFHLGFKDPAHFNKFFKNRNKITPREFRLRM